MCLIVQHLGWYETEQYWIVVSYGPSACQSVCLCICLSVCLSICLPANNFLAAASRTAKFCLEVHVCTRSKLGQGDTRRDVPGLRPQIWAHWGPWDVYTQVPLGALVDQSLLEISLEWSQIKIRQCLAYRKGWFSILHMYSPVVVREHTLSEMCMLVDRT